MKLYTDLTGKFQMYIPLDWEYKNPSLYKKTEEGLPQAFGRYEKGLGAFQLSCKKVTNHIRDLIVTRKEVVQSSDADTLNFTEQLVSTPDRDVYMFSCAVDDHYFFATYIVTPKPLLRKQIEAEVGIVREVLSSIKFIKEPFRQIVLSQNRLDLYMASIATIIELKSKAIEKESHIEYIVFSANHIDALLRLSIMLTNQIKDRNENIDLSLLFQSESDKPIMERAIYKKCLDANIIDHSLFNDLERLYLERNKVIHRFIITDIRTEDIFNLAVEYERINEKVEEILLALEAIQVKEQVGIWRKELRPELTEEVKERLKTKIRDKHGKLPKKR